MKYFENFFIIVKDIGRTLLRNKRQSILTFVSIAIAVFVVLIILASGTSSKESLKKSLHLNKSSTTIEFTANNTDRRGGFSNADKEMISTIYGLKNTIIKESAYNTSAIVTYKNNTQQMTLRIVGEVSANNTVPLRVISGGKINNSLSNYNYQRIAISDDALEKLTRNPHVNRFIGKLIQLNGKSFRIKSVFYASEVNQVLPDIIVSSTGKNIITGGISSDDEMIIPTISQPVVRKVLKMLDSRGTNNYLGTYSAVNNEKLYQESVSQISQLLTLISIVTGISIFVAGFGVMNAMLSSVSNRSREIGIRRALGATKNSIRISYMIEGTMLSVLGGVFGILAALLFCLVMTALKMKSSVSFAQISLTLLVTLICGIIFSVVPAMIAANKNVVEAIK